MNMFYKESLFRNPYDYDIAEDPLSGMSTDNSNPDAWVKPEMLRRISDRRFIDADRRFLEGQ